MSTVPYSLTPRYTSVIHDDDIFVLEQSPFGFDGMKQITVKDFLQPVYDKIATALTSMYKYMGSVNTYEDLPIYSEPQDPIPVYGILDGQHAGENFAWINDHWEAFGFKIDLSKYVTKDELIVSLDDYAPVEHTHDQAQIRNLNVIESLTIVKESQDDGGENIFSIQKTTGSSQLFTIKNGNKGSDSISYRVSGTGSITQNTDGSYSPEFIYLQSQKLTESIEAYPGRILIASEVNEEWVTVYPDPTSSWEDTKFLQFYIPANTSNLRIRLYESGTDYSEISDEKLLYEEHVSIAKPGLRGVNATSVEIEATSYVFKTTASGVIVSPNTIDFTAKLQNTSGTPSWTARSDQTTIKTGTGSLFTITSDQMSQYESAVITLVCDGISDTCTIMKIADGSDGTNALSVVSSNESFTIPTNSDKITTSAFSTEVSFTGFSGTTETDCTISNIRNLPSGMSAAINKNTATFSVPVSTPIRSDFGSISVELLCESATIVKTLSWSISKEGFAAQSISIEADSYIFKADTTGTIKNPDKITFTANRQNISSVPNWTATDNGVTVKSGMGTGFTITSSDMQGHNALKIQVSCEGFTDSCSIFVLSDGLSGYSTAQIRLCKRSTTEPAPFAGSTATYTFATNGLVFENSDDDGWTQSIPSGSGNIYVIYASANSQEATDTIQPNEWTTPVILSDEAVAGQNGYNVSTVMIFCRSANQPSLPSNAVTYSFESGIISGLPENWSRSIPSGTADLWVSQATAFSQTVSDVILPEEWATPTIMSSNGQSYNTAQLLLYKRAYELPAAYAGGPVTYDFTNAQFSFGTGGNDGWFPTPTDSTGNIYIICASVSSKENQVTINVNEWTQPQIYSPEPSDGLDGYNSATVFIYTRSAVQPSLPSASITYTFSSGEISNLPAPWYKTPPAGTLDLWVSQATAFANTASVLIDSDKWATPTILASNGTQGSNGYSSAQVILYKRNEFTPSNYNGSTVIYHFSTGEVTFAGSSDGWSAYPPSGSDNLYVIRASAASQNDTDEIAVNEWSLPVLYSAKAEDGADGNNGYNVATVYIYKRSETTPSTPSQDCVYTFETGEITGLSDGWNYSIVNGTEPLWVTQATAFSRSSTATIQSSQWSLPPTIMAKDGLNGMDAISIVCTNESFGIPTDPDGKTVDAFELSISFLGYLGTITKVVTLSDLSNVPTGMTASINGNTLNILVPANTTLEYDFGNITLIANCEGINISKSVNWNKNKQGITGEQGAKGDSGSKWQQGTILTGTGTTTGVAGEEGDNYLNTDTCNVYQCIKSGDDITAVWKYITNIKGEDGKSFTINITSSNGSIFREQTVNTILYCHVYLNNEEITDVLNPYLFNWKRNSGNPVEDEKWDTSSKAIAHKSVWITPADCLGRTTFTCEVDLSEFEI